MVERARATRQLRADFEVGDLVLVSQMLADLGMALEPVAPGLWERYLELVLDGMAARRRPSTP